MSATELGAVIVVCTAAVIIAFVWAAVKMDKRR